MDECKPLHRGCNPDDEAQLHSGGTGLHSTTSQHNVDPVLVIKPTAIVQFSARTETFFPMRPPKMAHKKCSHQAVKWTSIVHRKCLRSADKWTSVSPWAAAANAMVARAFGIPNGTDLANVDPISAIASGGRNVGATALMVRWCRLTLSRPS